MENFAYWLLKLWIKTGLYLYYGRIKIHGLENVPKNESVLFLPNHQGALMDVLLIVTHCRRKPYFLTRSDVFNKPLLNRFFTFLRMLPIFRMRDGRDALKKNHAVFDTCARLFQENAAIVIFPEANHNRKRRVRPLSKGFTRILFRTFRKSPNQNIHILPVGMNYVKNDGFPDRVTLYFGESRIANELYDPDNGNRSAMRLKQRVSDELKSLTTHIGDELDHERTVKKLDALRVDYLNPIKTNAIIEDIKRQGTIENISSQTAESNSSLTSLSALHGPGLANKISRTIVKALFWFFNLPIIAIWRMAVKPKIWEPEFTATLRFGFALLAYPIYFGILFAVLTAVCSATLAALAVMAILFFNWAYVRWT